MKTFEEALIYAAEKHKEQKRKDGSPYIWHPLKVAEMLKEAGYDTTVQIEGLLHDVVEDTDTSIEEIRSEFGEEIAECVDLLTKKPDVDENNYICAILENPQAKAVKNCDRLHNLWESVHSNNSEDFTRNYVKKSKKYYGKFSEALNKAINAAEQELKNVKSHYPNEWYYLDDIKRECVQKSLPEPPKCLEYMPAGELTFYEVDLYGKDVYCIVDWKNRESWGKPNAWRLTEQGWLPIDWDFRSSDMQEISFKRSYEDFKAYALKSLPITKKYFL